MSSWPSPICSFSLNLHKEVKAWVSASLCLCTDYVNQPRERWEAGNIHECLCLYLVPKYSHYFWMLYRSFSMMDTSRGIKPKYDKLVRKTSSLAACSNKLDGSWSLCESFVVIFGKLSSLLNRVCSMSSGEPYISSWHSHAMHSS